MAPLRRRAYIGLELVLSAAPDERGAPQLVVDHVDEDGPAARAGVCKGDVVRSIAGESLSELSRVRAVVAALAHHQPVALEIVREGASRELSVVPEPLALETLTGGTIELGEARWASHRLRAIWSWPAARGPHPLIWFLPGANWLSEDHATTAWHPIRKLVAQLTAGGAATLRLERSGTGDSEGPPCTELDLDAELACFRSGFSAIASEPRVDPQRVFVFARSLGGMLAPFVVAGQTVAGVAVWGSCARPWDEAMLRASTRQWQLSGIADERLQRMCERLEALHALVYRDGLTPAQAFERRPDLRGLVDEAFHDRFVYGRVARFFQQLQALDVGAAYASLSAPVLALHGSCDWLSELDDLAHIAQLCGARGRLLQLQGLDHFAHVRASVAEAFATPWSGEYSPALGEALLDFVGARG